MIFPHPHTASRGLRHGTTALGLVLSLLAGQVQAQDPAQSLINPGGDPQIRLSFAESATPDARISLSFLDVMEPTRDTGEPIPDTAIRLQFGRVDTAPGGIAFPEAATPREMRLASLWPLKAERAHQGRLRLAGEQAAAELLLLAAEGAMPDALVLSTVSSAYVLPDVSSLRVLIEGREIGTLRPENISGLSSARLPLPPGALQPGVNRLRIEAVQAHRYACGGEAAYDLWTDLDLSTSGAEFEAAGLRPDVSGVLAQIAAARGAGRPVSFYRPADGTLDAAALQVAQKLGQITGGGFDIVTVNAAAPIAPENVSVVLQAGPVAAVQSQLGTGGATLILQVGPEGLPDLDAALGTGFVAEAPPMLAAGQPVALADLGFAEQLVTDHLWDYNLAFALPRDWHIATNAQAELALRFANADALPEGARLRVLVNDAPVRLVPLHDKLHHPDTPLSVRFSSALLQAGRNVLGFEVFVPGDPGDAPCPTEKRLNVSIDAGSTLFVPASPSMSMAGLAAQLEGLDATALLPALRAAEDGASAGGILRLAMALPTAPTAQTETRLVFNGGGEVDPASFGHLWSSRETVRMALQQAPASEVPQLDVATLQEATAPVTTRMSLLAAPELVARARREADDLRGFLTDLVSPDPKRDLAQWMQAHQGQALLYQLDPADSETLHLALAPDAKPGEVVAALERARLRGAPLRGQAALLTWEGDWLGWRDSQRLPQLHEALSPANLRAVAGNYASARPSVFVAAMLGLTLMSALAAFSFLLSTRSRR